MSGYFLVTRGLFKHPLFKSKDPFSEREAWLWLIEHANFADGSHRHHMQTYPVPRGSLASSYRALAEAWRWSPNRVIRVLSLFGREGMVAIETEHGFVMITLSNYRQYQEPWNDDGTAAEHERDAGGTRTDTNQIKEKKEKKETQAPTSARMPFDEMPSDWAKWAVADRGWDASVIVDVWTEFRSYWTEGKGKSAKRSDWFATWRIWCRKENIKPKGSMHENNHRSGGSQHQLNLGAGQPGRSPRGGERLSWAETGDQLAAKYLAEAERE